MKGNPKKKRDKSYKIRYYWWAPNILDELPTGVFVQILKFLPMKERTRTSVFSKDWKYLQTYNPNRAFYEFRELGFINSGACGTIKISLAILFFRVWCG